MGVGLVTPVLLAGGSGTRLWPVSRARFPKQFVPLIGDESLFQAAARRFDAPGFAAPMVVTAEDFRFIVAEQLDEVRVAAQTVLVEPQPRNTAPAAVAAALMLALAEPQALMLLAPADQLIPDAAAFRAAVERGTIAARDGRIVTFGIAPTHAETGYGWLECGQPTHPGVESLTRFIEKPASDLAATLLGNPRCLWNSGLFLMRADVLIAAARTHAPAVVAAAERALADAQADLGFVRLAAQAWSDAPDISIDHAIMEHATNLSVVRFDGRWTDLGSWAAVFAEAPRDATGTALQGRASAIACENTLLRSDHDGVELIGIGLKNVVAVATRDAVLVADSGSAQSVRLAVETLKARGVAQATEFSREHRPWGWYETIGGGDRFKVKRIHVHPGAALSLQSHLHRAEHWVVVQGTARVTVGDKVSLVTENQSIYVPLGEIHRLENPGRVPMVLIEVQTGTYLGEDDIIRYEDRYARV
ncbi:MAG: mannose-1-phosphate guanylyltransferase/mannose-6-phosphate isomerase [Tabrizicola sp.]|nr:mannose-1-phosphate guanylyltransferase/mannose-6-phosphate isomerase [Tabrizicola sp.]